MELAELLFGLLSNIILTFINWKLFNIFLEQRKNIFLPPIIWLGLVCISNWCIWFFGDNINVTTVTGILSWCVIIHIIFEGRLFNKVLLVFLVFVFGIGTEDLVYIFISKVSLIPMGEITGNMLVSIFQIIAVLVLEKVFVKSDERLSVGSYIGLIGMMLSSFVLGEIILEQGSVDDARTWCGIFLLYILNITMFYIIEKINQGYHEKTRNRILEERILMYDKQFLLMKESQNTAKKIRHDLKNHIMLLEHFLSEKKYEDAENYLEQMQEYMQVDGQYVSSGNTVIDAIINYMLQRAELLNAKIEVMVSFPEDSIMNPMDMNILFGNLLENALRAIEEIEDEEKRKIGIKINYKKGIVHIHIFNSYEGEIKRKGNQILTTKNDKIRHGIGLENVRQVVEKYQGNMDIDTRNQLFNVNISFIGK